MRAFFLQVAFLSAYFVLIGNCLSQDTARSESSVTPRPIREIKSIKQLKLQVGKTIGYKVYPEDIGYRSVSGIAISGEAAYICDQGLNQLTKIDLNTGGVIVSKKIDASPWDVMCFNGHVYVTANNYDNHVKVLLVFERDLQLVLEQEIGFNMADNWDFYTVSQDSLMISYEIFEPLVCDSICLVRVDTHNKIRIDTVSEAEFCSIMLNVRSVVPPRILRSSNCEKEVEVSDFVVRGKRFKMVKEDDRSYMVTDYGWFEMPSDSNPVFYPGFKSWRPKNNIYTASNFDFTSDKVVFFEIDSRELTLYICRYY